MKSRSHNAVTSAATTAVTNITGLRARSRGIKLDERLLDRLERDLAIEERGVACFLDMESTPSEGLAGEHQEMLDDGPKGQRREILQAAQDQDHADEQADEQRAVGREGARPTAGPSVLAASDPAIAMTGTT